MMAKTGSLSINSENIFPVIKKWLYSDHDIFVRELISNGCDAVTKLKKLDMMGEYSYPDDFENKVTVIVSPEKKTMKFIDTGLGMDAAEVEEYITQIAFSGATAFLDKYKDKTNEDQIIGHFGLGFYSAFMVADEVHIDTLSYKEGAKPVHWECDGGTEYTMDEGTKTEVGTEITLFLNEESLEFANEYRAREIIKKYCSFMPTPIFLEKEGAETQYETIDKEELTDKDTVIEEIHEDAKVEDGKEVSPAKDKVKIVKRPVALNDTNPLWTKHPNDCTKDEYLEFYRNVFMDYKEPLFWIHLNMDYPFNLKGILYFPKINMEYESIEGTIKLYNNQVFVADNIKEVIPEFLMLLKGVIDCPDLPLNVSRSALQNDGFVKKISDYISKKVADKLAGMCKTEKEEYEKYWDDISPFIKFGCLKDDKFCEKMNDFILFKNLEGKYVTLPECIKVEGDETATDENGEKVEAEVVDENKDDENKEPEIKKTIYYVTDEQQQSQYINMFKAEGMDAIILTHNIDQPFVQQLETKNEGIRFSRIDADLTETFKEEVSEDDKKAFEKETKTLTDIFRKALNNDKLQVKVEKLKDENVSSMITVSEESRRMADMMKMYSMPGMDMGMFGADGDTLVLNSNNALVKYIVANKKAKNVSMFAEQLYDLAVIANRPLSPEAMTKFVARSNKIMLELTNDK
ncbi:MAG: molecular chaperone HtpG [Lachnospiraceae bacterium]|nr:molecular chaperone HtpG [Lachnospiraceae bacterium]